MRANSRFVLMLAVLALAAGIRPASQVVGPSGGQQTPTPGTGFIAGQIVDTTGRPVAEASVVLVRTAVVGGRGSVAGPSNVIADAQGRYFFGGLPQGSYVIRADRSGYIVDRTMAVVLGDGEKVLDNRIRLIAVASLSGVVRDAAGDPVVGTEVIAFRRALVNGRPSLQTTVRGIKSDDRGVYRIPNLRPGDYLVCACVREPNPFDPLLLTTLASEPISLLSVATRALAVGADVVSLDDTLKMPPPTFHPNSQSVARAERVTLAPGEVKTAVDINVELVRATRVSGRILGAQSALQASSIQLLPALDAESGLSLVRIQPMLVQPDGRFDFASVPPGQYRLLVTHRETGAAGGNPSGLALGFVGARGTPPPSAPVAVGGPGVVPLPILWADQAVVVGEGGVRDLIVTLNPTLNVTGRLQFVGTAPQPTEQALTRSSVAMQLIITGGAFSNAAFGLTAANGTFRLVGALPGKYSLEFSGAPGYSTLKSVTIGGADVTDMPIEVGEKDLNELVLTYTDTPFAALTLSVAAAPGLKFDDASILLFSVDRKYWSEPVAARRRIRSLPLSSKGTAVMTDVPPGDYLVLLATGQDAVDWQEVSKLEAFSRRAQRITVGEGGKQTIEVRR